jgi:Tfp pilus assembly protein PilF
VVTSQVVSVQSPAHNSVRTALRGLLLSALLVALAGCGGVAELTASSTRSREEGIKMYRASEYVEAAGAFRTAVRTDPTDYRAYYWMGQSYDALKSHHQAITAYQAALDVQKRTLPGREDGAMRVKIIDAMAQSMAKGNDVTLQDEAMSKRPQTAEIKYVQAKAFQYLGDPDSAKETYTQASLLDKKDFAIAKDFGLFLEQIPGQRADATKQLRRAYSLNPKDQEVVAALRRLGIVPGPSLKEPEQLASPSVPKGPLPEMDVKKWREAQQNARTASTTEGAAPTGPRD